jgi:CRISPR type I-E-associated protein CasB/Cse2
MNYKEFVNDYLLPLTDEKNPERAALADLRRGLTEFPNLSVHMHRHIRPRLPERISEWGKLTYYLTAALFATHQLNTDTGNLGAHFHELLDSRNTEANKPIERRFTYLLAAHPQDLHFHLRQAITFLRSKENGIAVNWEQLMWDIFKWNDPDERPKVQEKWAGRFWQALKSEEDDQPSKEDEQSVDNNK